MAMGISGHSDGPTRRTVIAGTSLIASALATVVAVMQPWDAYSHVEDVLGHLLLGARGLAVIAATLAIVSGMMHLGLGRGRLLGIISIIIGLDATVPIMIPVLLMSRDEGLRSLPLGVWLFGAAFLPGLLGLIASHYSKPSHHSKPSHYSEPRATATQTMDVPIRSAPRQQQVSNGSGSAEATFPVARQGSVIRPKDLLVVATVFTVLFALPMLFVWRPSSSTPTVVPQVPVKVETTNVAPQQTGYTATMVTVPMLVGQSQREVQAWMRSTGLQVAFGTEVGYPYSASCRAQGSGRVVSQSPRAGSQVRSGSTVWAKLNC